MCICYRNQTGLSTSGAATSFAAESDGIAVLALAAFAFRLAREATGNLVATYKKGEGSRTGLMENEAFASAFADAKARIRAMDVRFVEESDPVRQALLEIYVSVVLSTPYNDFDTH